MTHTTKHSGKNGFTPKTTTEPSSTKSPKSDLRGLDFEDQQKRLSPPEDEVDTMAPRHKKPSRPKDVKGKDKDSLETLVENKGGNEDILFQDQTDELFKKNPNYFVQLVAYKLSKHYDNDAKRPHWLTRVPQEAVQLALHRLYPDDTDTTGILSGLEHAVAKGDGTRIAFHAKQDLDAAFQRFWVRINAPKTRALWLNSIPASLSDRIIDRAVAESNEELTKALSNNLFSATLPRLRTLAASNPRFFVRNILRPMKSQNQIVGWLKDTGLKDILETGAGGTWTHFVEETPQVAVVANAQKRVETKEKRLEKKHKKSGAKGPAPKLNATQIVDEIFDCFVNNRGINLSYFTNALDQDRIILTGGTQHDKDMRPLQLDAVIKDKARQPGTPATQCHNLLGVFRHVVESYPGLDITYTTEDIAHMLLTKPIDALGTRGLLSNFGGNVALDSGKFTREVLFTGNDDGCQSHTWSVINGKAYDPVLGTKGSQVAASKGNEFAWVEVGKLAKGTGGWFIVKDPNISAPSNTHGFGSAYRRTKDPSKYGFTV